MSAETCTVSATVRLTGQRPQSTVGDGYSIRMRLGDLALARAGTSTPLSHMRLPRTSGVQLHLTSLPGGKLGASALAVRRLARGGGPVVVAGAAARAAQSRRARPTRRRRLSLRGAGSWPIPTRRCRPPSATRSASATDSGSTTGRPSPAATRAINDQVRFDREWSALRAYAARARRAPDRRRADLRRARQRRPRAPARALPRRRRGRRPARRLHRQGPALGQPDLRLAARCAAGATAGGSSACAAPSSSSTSPASTTSAASRPTGRCPRGARDASGGRWVARAGPRACSTRRAPSWAGLPLIAEDLGVITPAVTRLRESLGLPGDGRAAVRLQPATSSRASHRPERYRAGQVLYTGTHDNDTLRGWYESLPPESVAARARRGRAAGASRGGGSWSSRCRRRRGCACSRPRTCSAWAREARMNMPGVAGGQWRGAWRAGELTPALARRLRRLTAGGWPSAVSARRHCARLQLTEGRGPPRRPAGPLRRAARCCQQIRHRRV